MIHRYFLFLTTIICTLFIQSVSAQLNQQRPEDVSEEKWSTLKMAVQEAKLLPTPEGTGGAGSEFGSSIAVDGDRALIGAPRMVDRRGAAFIYDYDGSQWNETQLLLPADIARTSQLGISVSLSGDVALIGANQSDDLFANSGSVYVFKRINGSWVETAKLAASDPGEGYYFGTSVDLSATGDRVLIGAYGAEVNGTETGAAYVFDFDGNGWNETAKLTADDGGIVDWFGVTVSLSGDRAMVGAPRHDDQLNGLDAGAAYVFEYDGIDWSQTARLRTFDGASGDYFAYTVSLDNDRAVLAARFDDDLGDNSGSAYVFNFDGSSWNQGTKLTAADGAAGDYFGGSVSLVGDQVLIGARLHDLGTSNEGAAYLFDFNGSSWNQTTKFSSSDVFTSDWFGYTVNLTTDRVLVTALGDDDLGASAGTVFVFDYDGNSWVENQKLIGRNGASRHEFGRTSVSLSGNRALVGAHRDFEPGIGFSGSAYIFEYDGNTWIEQAKLKPSDTPNADWFGRAVRLRDNRAIIGSYRSYDAYVFEFDGNSWIEMAKLSPAITESIFSFGIAVDIEGDRAVVGTREDGAGAVYVYQYNGTEWVEAAQLTASDAEQDDLFGNSVSLLGDRVVIGAREADDARVDSGAAYVFDFDGSNWNETTKLTASDGVNNINFAWSVSLADDRLVIGNNDDHAYVFEFDGTDWFETFKLAPFAGVDTGGYAESVSLQDNVLVVGARNAADGGAAFVYQFDGSNWNEAIQLSAIGGENGDQFGSAVSLSGDKVLIGAFGDDDRGTNAGAAYVFDLNSTYSDDLIYRNGFDNN